MIDKVDFYHGATILKAIEDPRCNCVNSNEIGYLINKNSLVILKYSTKSKTPWQFTFSKNDLDNIVNSYSANINIYVVLICASDGLCALKCQETLKLLNDKPGVICIKRKFNEQYKVYGPGGQLVNKVSFNRWPKLLFEDLETIKCQEND